MDTETRLHTTQIPVPARSPGRWVESFILAEQAEARAAVTIKECADVLEQFTAFRQSRNLSELDAVGASLLREHLLGLGERLAATTASPRCDRNARETAWGDRWRAMQWTDVFIVTPQEWAVALALRTGDRDFARALLSPLGAGGLLPEGFAVRENRLWKGGSHLPLAEEDDLFSAIGIAPLRPVYPNLSSASVLRRQARRIVRPIPWKETTIRLPKSFAHPEEI